MQTIIQMAGNSIINNNSHYHEELNYCYPDFIFINKEEISDLICPINFGILNDPVTDTCGHAFCKRCIMEWVRTDSKCPFSRKPLLNTDLYPNLTIKNILNKQNVKCVNSDCIWRGLLENLINHLEKDCDYTKVKCKYIKCNMEADRKDIILHENRCEMKIINCEFCHKNFELTQYYKHKDICHSNTIKCEYCNEMVAKCFFSDHIKKECMECNMNCCLSDYGCPLKLKKKEMDFHLSQNLASHLTSMDNKYKRDINYLMEENKKIKSENVSKFQEIWEFSKQLKSVYESENHFLKNEIISLKSKIEKFKLENDDLRDSFILMKSERQEEIKSFKLIIEDFFTKNKIQQHLLTNSYQSHKQLNNSFERPINQQKKEDLNNNSFDFNEKNKKNPNKTTEINQIQRDVTPPKDLVLKGSKEININSSNNNKLNSFRDIFGQKIKESQSPIFLDFEKCKPKKILPLPCHGDFIEDICNLGINNKNLSFATCSNDKLIKIWNITSNNSCILAKTLEGHISAVNRILHIPKKKLILSSGSDGVIKFWRSDNWTCLKTLQAHNESVLGLTYIEDSNYFASSSVDKSIIVWDLDSYNLKLNFELNEVITEIYYVNLNGLEENNEKKHFETNRINEPHIFKKAALLFEKENSYILAGDAKGNIYLNEFYNKSPFVKLKKNLCFKAHEDAIYRLLLISSNKTIVSTSFEDDKIKIWNAFNMELIKTLQIFDRGVISVTYDPLNEVLISAGQRDNACLIKIIKIEKYVVLRAFKEEYSSKNVLWIPEKNVLISSGGTIGFQGKMNIIFF